MKAIKLMLSGIMLVLLSLFCLVTAGGVIGIILLLLAIGVFLWGLMTK